MSKKYELRFTGSGGQGVILASVIIAEAAVLNGMNAIQSQAYGPEARGGTSKAETIVSDSDLWFSKIEHPDFLLALTQSALEKYVNDVRECGIIMVDDSLTAPEAVNGCRVISLPILAAAKDRVGKAMTANIVAVGAINACLGLFPEDVLQDAVKRHIPRGTEELNMKALQVGEALVREERMVSAPLVD